jgi:hypothetical protein
MRHGLRPLYGRGRRSAPSLPAWSFFSRISQKRAQKQGTEIDFVERSGLAAKQALFPAFWRLASFPKVSTQRQTGVWHETATPKICQRLLIQTTTRRVIHGDPTRKNRRGMFVTGVAN